MLETSIWNDFWHFDRLSSFDGTGNTNYGDEVAAGWKAFFGSLPHGASILDLCTGNGAIAVIAAETSRREGKNFRIVAVDAADINPYLHVTKYRDELAAIEFRPATPIENLPWPAASFDTAVSQYGIEYSDLSRSIPELARVLAPSGMARLCLHAAEGPVVERAGQSIAEIDFLLMEIDLVGAAQRCLRACATIERGLDRSERAQADARRSFGDFRDALQRADRLISAAADPMMLRDYVRMLMDLYQRRMQYDTAQLIGLVEEIRTEWRNHRGRLAAQLKAALTHAEGAELAERLRNSGAGEISASDQMSNGELIGHCIEARF